MMKLNIYRAIANLLVFTLFSFSSLSAPAKPGLQKPPLVVVIVIDQFRADFLTKHRNLFLPNQGPSKMGGFRYLMDRGAHYPFAEYEVSHSMTCPGHAMILSGSYPYANGIPMNEFRSPSEGKVIYCAKDSKHGLSPGNLLAPTLGDQLRLDYPESRSMAVALKDRSAIMLAGKSGQQVYWFDQDKLEWVTSSYYKSFSEVPSWLVVANGSTQKLKGSKVTFKAQYTKEKFAHESDVQEAKALGFPFGVELTFDFAKKMILGNKLGFNKTTDLLAISVSSHDIAGHQLGPNAPEMLELTLAEDRALADFFEFLHQKIPGGLKNVLVVLTADHGVSPIPVKAQEIGLDAGIIDQKLIIKNLNDELAKKFGALSAPYIADYVALNFYFSPEVKISSKRSDIESYVKKYLENQSGILYVSTETDVLAGRFLPGMFGEQMRKTYIPFKSGDVVIYPKPFWIDASKNKATHLTGYTYDRMVPILFAGPGIQSGTYAEKAHVVDIAPTISYILGIIPPAMSEGKILGSAIPTW